MVSHPSCLTSGEQRTVQLVPPRMSTLRSAAPTLSPQLWGQREGVARGKGAHRWAGAEPMAGLQLLDASRVLADVDDGGLRRRRVEPGTPLEASAVLS